MINLIILLYNITHVMSKLSNREHVSIYLNNDELKQDIAKSTPYEKYIIHMNENLQEKQLKLISRINDLEGQNKAFEEEVDKYDVSKRYMRGLLKNLSELEKLYSSVNLNYKNELKILIKDKNDLYIKHEKILKILLTILIPLYSVLFNYNIYLLIITILYISINIYLFYKLNTYIILKTSIDNINEESTLKIKIIKDSQDYLDDYIDNL